MTGRRLHTPEQAYSAISRRLRLHLLSEAERPQIGPYRLDVGQTFRFGPTLACIRPSERVAALGRPDRILLFVVYDDFVDRRIFAVVTLHSLTRLGMASTAITPPLPAKGPALSRSRSRVACGGMETNGAYDSCSSPHAEDRRCCL